MSAAIERRVALPVRSAALAAPGRGVRTSASLEAVTDLPELDSLRHSIDNIDAALIHMLAERFKLTQSVGVLKAERGLPPSDPEREKEQVARLRALAEAAHLDPEFAEKYFNFIVAEVIHHHQQIAGA